MKGNVSCLACQPLFEAVIVYNTIYLTGGIRTGVYGERLGEGRGAELPRPPGGGAGHLQVGGLLSRAG